MSSRTAKVYKFGDFRLSEDEKILFRGDGEMVEITPKALEILLVLVENAGRIVPKEEIFERVWKDSFVEEANLSHHVFRLRKALGEDSGQKFIETVPKRGYRFVAEVRETPDQSSEPESRDSKKAEGDQTKGKSQARVWAAAVAVLIAAAIGFGSWWAYAPSAKARRINSIAVLPLANETGDPESEYLSDGIAESLINRLARLPELEVKARGSVFRYKGRDVSPQQIGKELSVEAVLSGRIVRRGELWTLSLELIDAASGNQLWGEQYNRKATDLASLESAIAADVSETLRARFSRARPEQVAGKQTENNEAYELYLQGRFFLNQNTESGYEKAVLFFDRALALDPRYALAYAARAEAHYMTAEWTVPNNEAIPKAKADLATALSLDDALVEALIVSAYIKYQYDWDFSGAEAEFEKAIALNPNHSDAHRQYGWYLSQIGRTDEAFAEMQLAVRLDPFSPAASVDAAAPLIKSGRYDAAIEHLEKSVDMHPNFFIGHFVLGWTLAHKNEYAEAIKKFERAKELDYAPFIDGGLGYAYAKSGEKDKARRILGELKARSKEREIPAYWLAMIHLGLDEKDEALFWLEKAYREKSFWLLWLKTEAFFDDLRPDPRFQDLLRRINFPADRAALSAAGNHE